MRAVGVASPREQGQATTRTVTIAIRPRVSPSSGERRAQHRNEMTEMAMITGTNIAATLSTRFWMRALLPWASLTIRMMAESIVSFPVFSAVTLKGPPRHMVPANTFEPGILAEASDSPVSMLSSTLPSPESTSPSTGTRSPGLIVTTSPTDISLTFG